MTRNLFTEPELRDLYERQRLSLTQIAEQKGVHNETVRQYLILFGIPRRSIAEATIRYPRTSFSGNLIEKAYLLGFRAGDLNVHLANYSPTSETVTVACTSSVPEQIELIRSLFERYGHVHLSTGAQQSVITIFLDRSFSFLLPKEDRIEEWVLADKQHFAAYLAGYIDAEGCIQVKRRTHASELIIRSYDVCILRTCQSVLQTLGVVCPPIHYIKREGERDGNGPVYHHDYWALGVFRQESLARLFALIDLYLKHPVRRQDMMSAWQNIKVCQSHREKI